MPNRILRDWTDSKALNGLSWQEEVLFTRLIMKADDYGRYYADSVLLKSLLFPRKNDLRCDDIARWLQALEAAGLILTYRPQGGDLFLSIVKFNQRLRIMKSSFPEPPDEKKLAVISSDGHTSDIRRRETREGNEVETKRSRNEVETREREEPAHAYDIKSIIKIFVEKYPEHHPACYADIIPVEKKFQEMYIAKLKALKEKHVGEPLKEKVKSLDEAFNADMNTCYQEKVKIVRMEAQKFFSYYDGRGWVHSNKTRVTNLSSAVKNWMNRKKQFATGPVR